MRQFPAWLHVRIPCSLFEVSVTTVFHVLGGSEHFLLCLPVNMLLIFLSLCCPHSLSKCSRNIGLIFPLTFCKCILHIIILAASKAAMEQESRGQEHITEILSHWCSLGQIFGAVLRQELGVCPDPSAALFISLKLVGGREVMSRRHTLQCKGYGVTSEAAAVSQQRKRPEVGHCSYGPSLLPDFPRAAGWVMALTGRCQTPTPPPPQPICFASFCVSVLCHVLGLFFCSCCFRNACKCLTCSLN